LTRKLTRLAAAVLVALAAAAAAVAAPGTPDVSQMALRATDIPGAKVTNQGVEDVDQGYEAGYSRSLAPKTPWGRSKIVFVASEVDLANTADGATADFADLQQGFRTQKGRDAFAMVMAKAIAGKNTKRSSVAVGKLRTPKLGDAAVELPVSVKLKKGRAYFSVLFFRIDRAFVFHLVAGLRPIAANDSVVLGTFVTTHIGEGLVPLPVSAPSIAGTAQQGQTLTATAGTWGNRPQLSYQWQSCDAAGACADIAGATASTYVVGAADAGKTLRVVEKATNRFGTATAQSAATAAVV
jgi:hypothetical protein